MRRSIFLFILCSSTASTSTFSLTGSAADYTKTYTGATLITRILMFVDITILGTDQARINFTDSGGIELKVLSRDLLKWIGYVQPDQLSRKFVDPAYFISLAANDAIGTLKDVQFTGLTDSLQSPMYAITMGLANTGLPLNYRTQVNIKENHIPTTNVLKGINANFNRRFKQVKDGKITYIPVYDGLAKTVDLFNAKLCQADGYYQIFNKNELSSTRTYFDWSTLTPSATSYNRTIDITYNHLPTDADELSKIRPLKSIGYKLINGYAGSNELASSTYTNGNFESFTDAGSGNVIVEESIHPNSTRYFTSSNFTLGATTTANTVTISFSVLCAYGTTDYGFYPPLLQVDLIGSTSATKFLQLQYGSQFISFEVPFTSSGTYHLKFTVYPDNRSNYTSNFETFGGISVVANYQTSPVTDRSYTAAINSSTAVATTDEIEMLFGDTYTSNELAALFYNSTARTSTWTNYGSSSGSDYQVSIQSLYGYNKLALRQKFKDYLRVTAFANNIDFNNAIKIRSKYYNIQSYSYDFKFCKVQLELSEIPTAAIATTVTETVLTSVNGESQ